MKFNFSKKNSVEEVILVNLANSSVLIDYHTDDDGPQSEEELSFERDFNKKLISFKRTFAEVYEFDVCYHVFVSFDFFHFTVNFTRELQGSW